MDVDTERIRSSARPRLLWLIDSLTMGGAEQRVPTFVRHLDQDRFALRVACVRSIGGNPLAAAVEEHGTPVINLGATNLRDIAAFRRLLRLLREDRIDLVHAHLTYADIWGRLAAGLVGCRSLSTVHVPFFFNYWRPSRRDALVESIARAVRTRVGGPVIAESEWLRGDHIARGLPAGRIIALHNGIELDRFTLPPGYSRAAARAEMGLPSNAPVLIMLAVLREGKGHDALLEAAPEILRRNADARILIVGGGPLEGELRSRVAPLAHADRVHFTGVSHDSPAMLSLADVYILPSRKDPLPNTVMEAMAMSLPVVGLRSGGVPEMVIDGETGILVPPGDAHALAQAALRLLDDLEVAREMGRRARVRMEQEFSAARWVRRLEALYGEILGEHEAWRG